MLKKSRCDLFIAGIDIMFSALINVAGCCQLFPSRKSCEELFEIFRLNLKKRNSTWKFGSVKSYGRLLIFLL